MPEGEKTEKATPKKRNDERKKGNVFMSRDAVSVATLIGSFSVLWLTLPTFSRELGGFMTYCLEMSSDSGGDLMQYLNELVVQCILVVVKTAGPVLLVTLGCAVAATFAQTRFLIATEPLKPKLSKLSPLKGFKRLFSLKSVVEAVKGILKIILLMAIIYFSIQDMFLESSKYLYTDLDTSSLHLVEYAAGMVMRIAVAFVALAGADFLYQKWDYERQMKMTKQEVKEEFKNTEGNPEIKGRIRRIQRQMAMSRMMQSVPEADVIIRNPTHFAVALKYDPDKNGAPVVLAKGQDHLALRIIKVGQENGVFVLEDRPLARALYASCEVDREIPAEFYGAVAEILVYIYKASGREDLFR